MMPTSQLINYTVFLADSNHIISQRNAEWCGHGPVLEQDIALTNITLDLLGQARHFYQYAAALINEQANAGAKATEDSLAYLRGEREYKNLLLCELPKGDWAHTVLRQFFFSAYAELLYTKLSSSTNQQIAAIAQKSLKEVLYHVRWSAEWCIRLGDGTVESHNRMLQAISEIWPYTGEMFIAADFENALDIDVESLKQPWHEKVATVLEQATLPIPDAGFMQTGGKSGMHTEHLGYILAEMQYLQRVNPGAEW